MQKSSTQCWPKVFLCINAYSGPDGSRIKYLNTFLKSIQEHTTYPNLTVCISDDSPDEYAKQMEELVSIYKYEYHKPVEKLKKWHRVRNEALKLSLESDADYYMTFDDDYIVIQDNWIRHIITCMENIPSIGILGCHWACLEDGRTRQAHHSPIGILESEDKKYSVTLNNFVTGGCWTIRAEVAKILGLMPEHLDYYGADPGPDTVYCNKMLQETQYKLCNTRTDLAWHTGQEFMKSKEAVKRYQ